MGRTTLEYLILFDEFAQSNWLLHYFSDVS